MRDWFHLPFAWFGDRTAFVNFRIPLQFFPTDRRLEPGMPFILDMAPVYKGFTADIGYSGSLGLNPVQDRLMADLRGAPRADPARGARAAARCARSTRTWTGSWSARATPTGTARTPSA